jgi:hypothetical protein
MFGGFSLLFVLALHFFVVRFYSLVSTASSVAKYAVYVVVVILLLLFWSYIFNMQKVVAPATQHSVELRLSDCKNVPGFLPALCSLVGSDYVKVGGIGFVSAFRSLARVLREASTSHGQVTCVRLLETACCGKPGAAATAALGALCFMLHPVADSDGTVRNFCSVSRSDVGQLCQLAGDHPWLTGMLQLTQPVAGVEDSTRIAEYCHVGCRPCNDTHPVEKDSQFLSEADVPHDATWRVLTSDGGPDSQVPVLDIPLIVQFLVLQTVFNRGLTRAMEMFANGVARVEHCHQEIPDDNPRRKPIQCVTIRGEVWRSMRDKNFVACARLEVANNDSGGSVVCRIISARCDKQCTRYSARCCTYVHCIVT